MFSSTLYCFGYNETDNQTTNQEAGTYDDQQIMSIQRRYAVAYNSLTSTEERIAFVHLFLEKLTRKTLVFPVTANRSGKQIKVGLKSSDYSGNRATLWQINITLSDPSAVYNGLMALPRHPKFRNNWPELFALAKNIIKARSGETSDPIETVIQDPTQEDCSVSGDDGSNGGCSGSGGGTITWQDWKDWAEKNEMDSCNYYLCSMMWVDSPILPGLETCMTMYYPDGTSADMMYCWSEGGHADFP
ncbi:MAG: hypothetical protein HRT35_28120 [Algicola sp.]|nr:hypothetical protein [Algicola sp.]